jgi:hypothetical protein
LIDKYSEGVQKETLLKNKERKAEKETRKKKPNFFVFQSKERRIILRETKLLN